MHTISTRFLAVLFLVTNPTSVLANDASSDYCAVSADTAGNLDSACTLFQASCSSYTLVGCDTGGWQCSSAVIGLNSPVGAANNNTTEHDTANTTDAVSTDYRPTEPTVIPSAAPDPITPFFTESNDSGECYLVGTGFTQSVVVFELNCASYQHNDCDTVELFYIIDDQSTQSVNDFADKHLS